MDCTKGIIPYIRPRGPDIMSYGYFQGEEAQALVYYKKLLETEADPRARKELADLVAELEKVVPRDHPLASTDEPPVQNACSA